MRELIEAGAGFLGGREFLVREYGRSIELPVSELVNLGGET